MSFQFLFFFILWSIFFLPNKLAHAECSSLWSPKVFYPNIRNTYSTITIFSPHINSIHLFSLQWDFLYQTYPHAHKCLIVSIWHINFYQCPNCLSLQPGKTVTTDLNVRKTLVLNLLSHWESTLCSLSTEFTQPCDDKSLDQKRAISFCAGVLFVCCLFPKELSQFISHIWPLRTTFLDTQWEYI